MTDALGLRAVFSVVLPATNSIAEPDMAALRPPGVSNQTFRFPLPGRPDTLDNLFDLMRPTVDLTLACQPDRIIVGYTSEFLPDGIIAASQLRAFVENAVGGRPTTMASDAVPDALKALGAKRIGIVTPYLPSEDRNVEEFFTARGFSFAGVAGLSSARDRLVGTAQISEADVRDAFTRVDAADIEVLVQIGTNLACAGFATELEARHGKPVIAVNTATYWLALRSHGITDRLDGHGTLLARH
ncbi:MAG: arylmalonate decarboxylase [Proteobacteria bacterium]|nr:arylmalonate decarboxylase [Pseudomonadota bacterium]